MNKNVLKSGVILPLLKVVTRLKLSQLEIPVEWDELFEREEKKQFIINLKKQIEKSGYCNPVVVFKFEDKYVIVDGVLRFLALKDLNLNEVDCIILESSPNSKDEVKDWIIEFNLKSVPTIEERKRLLSHYLRVVDTESELDDSTYNEKYRFISEQYGRGWGRNNVITFKKSLVFEKENPENTLNLSNKLLDNEVAFDRAKGVLNILNDEKNNYDLEKEKEAKVIEGFLNKKYDLRKTESLVRQYNHKKETGTTNFDIVTNIISDRYMILPGNSLDVKFPEGTLINGILTSIPYYNQIEYSEKDSKNSEFEIGREKKPELFIRKIIDVMKIGSDNMTEDGVIIINLHDSYQDGICVGVVPLLILEMQKEGFFFIDQVIWQKSNNKPQGNKTKRFTNGYESVLIFSKSKDYYYNQLKIYDPNKSATVKRGCSEQGNKDANLKTSYHISNQYKTMRNFLCDNDIEQVLKLNISKERSQQGGLQTGFFGSFPTLLPLPFILSFIPEGGVIFDPFAGTGSVGRAGLMLNRKVIMSELYDKNIPKIKEVLEKGISEYDENEYLSLKNDFFSNEDDLQNVA